MSLPPCVCPDPHSPGGCTCAWSRQWLTHSHALFANSSRSRSITGPSPIPLPHIPLTTLHHAHHGSHESHSSNDSRNFFHSTHAFPNSNFQNTVFPHVPHNTISPIHPQSRFHYFHPSPHVAPVAPQATPSPLKGRKRKSNAAGRGGGGSKRQRVPAPIVAAPTSAICGVGPTFPLTSDNDPPSSPQLLTTAVQPPTTSSQAPSASTQLPSASYSSLRTNRKSKERSSSATDMWYFCRTSNSETKLAEPPPDQEPILKQKPRSPFITCKLCKCVFPSFF